MGRSARALLLATAVDLMWLRLAEGLVKPPCVSLIFSRVRISEEISEDT